MAKWHTHVHRALELRPETLLKVLEQPAAATYNVSKDRSRAKTAATLAYLHNGKLDYPARILRYMQDPELHGLIFSEHRKPVPALI